MQENVLNSLDQFDSVQDGLAADPFGGFGADTQVDTDQQDDSTVAVVSTNYNVDLFNEVIKDPHIRLDVKDFNHALTSCLSLIESMSTDDIYKSVLIQVEETARVDKDNNITKVNSCFFKVIGPGGNKLHFHCDILNTENVLTEPIFISLSLLSTVAKSLAPHISIIKKEDGAIYLRLSSGDLKISTLSFDVNRFALPDGDATKFLTVNNGEFSNILDKYIPLVNNAIRSNDKRVYFHNNAVYFNDINLWSKSKFKDLTADLTLRLYDMKTLKKIADSNTSGVIDFYTLQVGNIRYTRVITYNSSFVFVTDTQPFDTAVLDGTDLTLVSDKGIDVNFGEVKTIANLGTTLPESGEYVNFLITDDKLICSIEQKAAGLSRFPLAIQSGNTLPMKDISRFNSRKLGWLLALLNCTETVRIYLADDDSRIYLYNKDTDTYALLQKV